MKKLLIPIIALIVGFGIGYISKTKQPCSTLVGNDKQGVVNEKLSFNFMAPDNWIGRPAAISGMGDFQQWNRDSTHISWYTSAGQKLKGFFITIADLDSIMKKRTKDTKGISLYMAKDTSSASNSPVFTLIFMRADTNWLYKTPKDTIGTPYINDYDSAYDFVKPCPDDCGNFETARKPPVTTPAKPLAKPSAKKRK